MTISVCLATWNGAGFLGELLASILPQLGADDEVVVSDDASTDDTVAVIRSLGDARVKVTAHTDNVGYARNFERALARAGGDIIFLADQDDVWLPDKVAIMVAALADADFAVSDARVVDADLRELAPSHFSLHGTRTGFWPNFLATRYIGACMAFRRPVLEAALPFPPRVDLCAHDYWLCLVAEARFRTLLVPEPLLLYRRHDGNASNGGVDSRNSLAHKVAVRAYCLAQLAAHLGRRS